MVAAVIESRPRCLLVGVHGIGHVDPLSRRRRANTYRVPCGQPLAGPRRPAVVEALRPQPLPPTAALTSEPMPQRFEPDACGAPRHRILAYGDSLTAGFHNNGIHFAPYAETLVKHLRGDAAAEIWVCGLSGITAKKMSECMDVANICDFVGRKGEGLRHALSEHGPFSLALIMAGTNDLGRQSPAAIAANIQAMHAACHRAGVRTVVLSVPPNKSTSRSPKHRASWRQLNAILQDWAQGSGKAEGVLLFVDTSALVPFSDDSKLWEEDGLHFSAAGSRQLGSRLAPLLMPLLLARAPPVAERALVPGRPCAAVVDAAACIRPAVCTLHTARPSSNSAPRAAVLASAVPHAIARLSADARLRRLLAQ
mmetsp:Transcript_40022/g.127342  ORF Transcript_40022/g.127342 Transcript_40022/m.127342 type:complete len:367 (-) Transcript_40022:294-1394(-)